VLPIDLIEFLRDTIPTAGGHDMFPCRMAHCDPAGVVCEEVRDGASQRAVTAWRNQ